MNIKDALRQKVKKQLEDNFVKAKKRCLIAETLIKQAYQLEKKELILKAVDIYLLAIDLHANLPEAYIGLAYIEFTFGSLKNSLKLLNQAKKISPENLELDTLIKTVKKEIKKQKDDNNSSLKNKISKEYKLNKGDIFERLLISFSAKDRQNRQNGQKIDENNKDETDENIKSSNKQITPKAFEFKVKNKLFQNTEGDSYVSNSKKSNDEILASLDLN